MNLYKLMQNEKERVGDDFIVSYNEEKNSIRYKTDDGIMTVAFNEKNKSEDFYYRNTGEQGLGDKVQKLTENGTRGHYDSSFLEMPSAFKKLAQEFQNGGGRDEILTEEVMKNKSIKKQHER